MLPLVKSQQSLEELTIEPNSEEARKLEDFLCGKTIPIPNPPQQTNILGSRARPLTFIGY